MDKTEAPPALPAPRSAEHAAGRAPDRTQDRLGAEVRESAVLLLLSLLVTLGLASALQALLALLD